MKTTNLQKKHGFTYIEILSVMAIMSITAAVAIPNYMNSNNSTIHSSMISDAKHIIDKEVAFYNTDFYYMEIPEDNSINKKISVTDSLNNKIIYNRTLGNILAVKPIKCDNGKNGFSVKVKNNKTDKVIFFDQCSGGKPLLTANNNKFEDLSKYDHYSYLTSLKASSGSNTGTAIVVNDTVDTTNPFENVTPINNGGTDTGGTDSGGGTTPTPSNLTMADLQALGISISATVTQAQLDTINSIIDQQKATTLTELQAIVDTVAPHVWSTTDLTTLGVVTQTSNLTQAQLDAINAQILATGAKTLAEIQAIVDSINPHVWSTTDLTTLGVVTQTDNLTQAKIDAINAQILATGAKTLAEIQAIVDSINPHVWSESELIALGVNLNTGTIAPDKLSAINAEIAATGAKTLAEIQAIVDSINPAPSLSIADLTALGVVSYFPITESNLREINLRINMQGATTLAQIQAIVDIVIPPTPVTGLGEIPNINAYANPYATAAGCPETPVPFAMSNSTTINSVQTFDFLAGSPKSIDTATLLKLAYIWTSASKDFATSAITNGGATTTGIYYLNTKRLTGTKTDSFKALTPTIAKFKYTGAQAGGGMNFLGDTTIKNYVNLEVGNAGQLTGAETVFTFGNNVDSCVNIHGHYINTTALNYGALGNHVLHVGTYSSETSPAYIQKNMGGGAQNDIITTYGIGRQDSSAVYVDLKAGNDLIKVKYFGVGHLYQSGGQNLIIGGAGSDQIDIKNSISGLYSTAGNSIELSGTGGTTTENNNLYIRNLVNKALNTYITGSGGRDIIRLSNIQLTTTYFPRMNLGSGDDIVQYDGVLDTYAYLNIMDGEAGTDTIFFSSATVNDLKAYFENPSFPERLLRIKFENIVGSDGIYKGRATQEMFYWNNITIY